MNCLSIYSNYTGITIDKMMVFKAIISAILILVSSQLSSGFVAPYSSSTNRGIYVASSSTQVKSTQLLATTRRNFLEQSTSIAIGTSILSSLAIPLPAYAKEAPPPITQEAVTEAFDAIRYELTNPSGVVGTLTNLINDGNSYEEVMQYTKESDAYFRRAKIGKARKLLTDKEIKSGSIQLSNAVTFDLIGINRASRPGQEDKDVQLKYLDDLKKDIEQFLELEKTIVIEE